MISLNTDFPDLSTDEIEAQAHSLLECYFGRKLVSDDVPIPVEKIAEQFLDYEIEIIEDGPYFKADILGGIVFDDRVIQVSAAVSDHDGRYNFTIAHEIGHHVLHRDIYLAKVKAEEDLAMCRELTKKPKAEMQADVFAAALLMPSEILEHAVNRCLLNKKLKEVNSLYAARSLVNQVKESGRFLNVSNTAILNRLIQLNFIEHIPYQGSTEKPNFTRRNLRIGYASTLIKKAIARIAMAIREK